MGMKKIMIYGVKQHFKGGGIFNPPSVLKRVKNIPVPIGLTWTKCNFRTFEVDESFWAKQQSCITLKVSLRKWCPFLFLFVLTDAILLKLDLQKRTSVLCNPPNEKLFVYKKMVNISKNWRCIIFFIY